MKSGRIKNLFIFFLLFKKQNYYWRISEMEVFKAPKITNSHSFNHIKNDDVNGISSTIPIN